MAQRNSYEVLGVPENSSKEEIRNAYRVLRRASPENIEEIESAYSNLFTENNREQYDARLKAERGGPPSLERNTSNDLSAQPTADNSVKPASNRRTIKDIKSEYELTKEAARNSGAPNQQSTTPAQPQKQTISDPVPSPANLVPQAVKLQPPEVQQPAQEPIVPAWAGVPRESSKPPQPSKISDLFQKAANWVVGVVGQNPIQTVVGVGAVIAAKLDHGFDPIINSPTIRNIHNVAYGLEYFLIFGASYGAADMLVSLATKPEKATRLLGGFIVTSLLLGGLWGLEKTDLTPTFSAAEQRWVTKASEGIADLVGKNEAPKSAPEPKSKNYAQKPTPVYQN